MTRSGSGRSALVALLVANVLGGAISCRARESGGAKTNDSAGAFEPLAVGSIAPTYSVRTMTGATVRIGAGEAPTLLNVWATWCASCREEMATLDSLQQVYGQRGLRVVAVSVDQGSAERVQRFTEANHLHFTVAHDPRGDVQQLYQVVGVPATYVLDRDGRLLWEHTGNIGDALGQLRLILDRALAGPPRRRA